MCTSLSPVASASGHDAVDPRHIELGHAPVQVELGPPGLFRGRERLLFRFRVAFSLYIRAPEELNLLVRGSDNQTL